MLKIKKEFNRIDKILCIIEIFLVVFTLNIIYFPYEAVVRQSDNTSSATSTLNVPSVDYPTIASAITAANSGDTIVVAAGTYDENIDFAGKNITIQSSSGATSTIIQGSGSNNPVVKFISGEAASAVLDGFTINNQAVAGNASRGIYISSSTPTIKNSKVDGNDISTAYGAGIYLTSGGATITDSSISNNNSGQHAGGIYANNSSISLTNSNVNNNSTSSTASYDGGGIFLNGASSSATISGGTINSNSGRYGAGIYVNSSTAANPLSITNATISSNNGGNYGAGIYLFQTTNTTNISGTTISNNTTESNGGGINSNNSPITIADSYINSNTAGSSQRGGGLYISGASSIANITNTTVNNNIAGSYGAGIYIGVSSNLTFAGGSINGNTQSGSQDGGGIVVDGGSTLNISKANIQGNRARYGGGMYVLTSSIANITNCNITGNGADTTTIGDGGGIYNSATVNVYNSTIAGNYAYRYGGGVKAGTSGMTITNSILWGNTAGTSGPQINGTPTVTYSDISGGFTGTGNINLDPLFITSAQASNGNPTTSGNFHIQEGSPVIDQGTATGAPLDDIDEDTRSGSIDIGSDEYVSTDAGVPTSSNLSPANGATGVNIDNNLTLTLADNGSGVNWSTFSIALSGDKGYSQTYTDADTDVVSKTGTSASYEVTVNPGANFSKLENISATVNVYDTAGNSLSSPTWAFRTNNFNPTTVTFQLNEAAGSSTTVDESGNYVGTVNDPAGSFPSGDGYFYGDASNNYIDFLNNNTAFKNSRAITIEARIKANVATGTGSYVKRIVSKGGGGTATNWQLSVWRGATTSYPNFTPPSGVASIAFWPHVRDAHGGASWKPVLTDYNIAPIVANHWYKVKVIWNSDKEGGTPGAYFVPADIYIDDQGTDGAGAGESWSGYINATDSDQSLLNDTTNSNIKLYTGDTMYTDDGPLTIGANTYSHANSYDSLIDWVTISGYFPEIGSGPVLSYRLNEGTGDKTYDEISYEDSSVTLGTLLPTYSSNSPSWTTGKIGSGLSFDGTDDYVQFGNPGVANFERTNAFTIETWARFDRSSPTLEIFLSKQAASYPPMRGIQVQRTGSNNIALTLVDTYNSSGSKNQIKRDSSGTITSGQWTHIVATYDGSSDPNGMNIYLNGALSNGTTTIDNSAGSLSTIVTTEPWRLGMRGTGGSIAYPFQGALDETVVYNKALNASEVTARHNLGDSTNPSTSNLSPANSATGVAGDSNLTLTLSDSYSGIDWTTFQITLTGDKGYSKTYTDADTSIVSKTGTSASYDVTVNPDVNFGNNEVITVTVNANDNNSNALTPPAWSFTTLDIPSAPTVGTPSVLSTTSIRWNFTDNASNEDGFKVHDNLDAIKASNATPNLTYLDETGLTPNTQYTRHIHAYNAGGDSDASANASRYTLADPPTLPVATDGTYTDKINVSWVAPLTGANHYHVYRDGVAGVGTLVYNAGLTSFDDTITGSHTYYIYSVNADDVESASYINDSGSTASLPAAPTIGTPSALSTTSIRWNFTDNASNEDGFKVHDNSETVKASSATPNLTYLDETGLTANTQYTRHVHAYNGAGDSTASTNASKYTLPAAPNVTADKSTSTWYNSANVVFTNAAGFGAGGVGYYRYVFDQNPSHTFNDTETQWTIGTLTKTATASGSWYLHVKSYNAEGESNGTQDYGTYNYDNANPTSSNLSPANSATGVLIDKNLTLTLSDADSGVDWDSFSIQLNGNKGYSQTYTELDTGIVSKTGTSASYDVTVNPDTNFSNNEVIIVTITVNDSVGNSLTPPTWSFTTGELPAGAISEWKFDEGSGQTASDSAGTNNGTMNGTDYWDLYGILGSGLSASGDDYSLVPRSATLEPSNITLEAWIKPSQLPSTNQVMGIINKRATVSPTNGYLLELWNNGGTQKIYYVNGFSGGLTYTVTLSLNTWYHIAVTHNGTTGTMYLNGNQVSTGSVGTLTNDTIEDLYIGKRKDGYYFKGTIDDVAIYNRALTGTEISERYIQGLPTSPTIGTPSALSTTSIRWNFTDNASNEDGFKVHDGTETVKASGATQDLTYLDETSLSPNTSYTRHVHAYNGAGDSTASTNATLYTLPNAPVSSSATAASTTQINVSWNAGAGGASSYKVRSSSDNYATVKYSGSLTNYSETLLTPNTSYTYRIYAANADGAESATYASVTKSTLADQPLTISATDGTWTNIIRVSWVGPSTGADHYHLYRDGESGVGTLIYNSNGTSLDDYDTGNHTYYIYSVNADDVESASYISDSGYNMTLPSAPTIRTPIALGTTSIRWNFTDNADNEVGFKLHDSLDNVKTSSPFTNLTYLDESSGLIANTQYTRHVHAYNGAGDSSASVSASKYTLSAQPNVTSNISTSTWYNSANVVFTNAAGFGSGGVEYYRYVWDQNATHTFDDTETQWTTGILTKTATLSGSWYLHVKSFNGDGVANGTQDYGPFYYDGSNPSSSSLSPANSTISVAIDSNLTLTLSDSNSGVDWTSFSIQLSGNKGYSQTYTDLDTSVVSKTGTSASYDVTVNPDTNFANNEVITVVVNINDTVGNALIPPTWSFTTVDGIPSAPTIGIPSALSTTSIRWNFTDNASNEDGFKVHDGTETVKASSATPNLSYLDETSLSPNTSYTRHVHAYNGSGDSSASANTTIYTLPNAPVSPLATAASTTQIDVSWSAGVGGADHYHVRSSSDNYATVKYNGSLTNYSETLLSPNTQYTYRIYAVNADDNESSTYATVSKYTLPNNPIVASATDGTYSDKIVVSWVSGGSQSGYKVYRDGDKDAGTLAYNGTSTTFDDIITGSHTYYVYAKNGDDVLSSSYSTDTGYTLLVPAAPTIDSPTSLSTTSIRWNFIDNANNETGFKLHDSLEALKASEATQNLSYLDENLLLANTLYTRHVHAYNATGDSNPSANASTYTRIESAAGISFDNVLSDTMTLSATGTISNLDSANSGIYFRNSTSSTNSNWVQLNSWVSDTLTPNTSYSFYAKTRNGDGLQSTEVGPYTKVTLASFPSAPTVSANYDEVNGYNTSITINAGTNPAATEFALSPDDGLTFVQADGSLSISPYWSTSTSRTHKNLSANTSYSYKVKARNSDLIETGFSALGSDTTAPASPSNLGATSITQTSASLSWDIAASTDSYTVSYGTDTSATNLGTSIVTTNSKALSSLVADTTYYFKVKATSTANGSGAYSTIASFKTDSLYAPSPSTIGQYKLNGMDSISSGGYHNESSAVIKLTNVSGAPDSLTLRAEVELKPQGVSFDGNSTTLGDTAVYNGSAVNLNTTISTLANLVGYHYRARILDDKGRTSPWTEFHSGSLAFTVDLNQPNSFSITTPANGSYIKGTVLLNANATDNYGISSTSFYRDSLSNLIGVDSLAQSHVTWSTIGKDGTHTLYAVAKDLAGNTRTIESTVKVDNYKPRTYAPRKATVRRGLRVKIYYKVSDPYSPYAKRLKIVIKKGRVTKKTLTYSNRHTNRTLYQIYKALLAKGKYTINIYATDMAGNAQYNVARNYLTIY